jgi:hypothetical protein
LKLIDELCEQTQKWSQKGIMVLAFRPPVSEKMLELENELSGFDQRLFIEKFEECGGTWLNIKQSDYETYDGSHLNRDSAVKLSFEIARNIRNIKNASQLPTAEKAD